MLNLQDYPERDRSYIQASSAASEMLKRREIRAYSTTHDRTNGRMIHVETDQGWDPHPMFQEFHEPGFASPPN